MSQLDVLAETVKLARFLGTEPAALDELQVLGATQLRELRERLSEIEFARTRPAFQRIAQASRLLPNKLVALLGEKVFGAMLCARVAGLMPPDRALELSMKMPDAFLADVAVALDPHSAREVIAAMPAPRVIAVALMLVQREDFITMGRFVGYLPPPVIGAAMSAIRSDEALLRTAFFIESKDTLNTLIGLLPKARLRSSILLAADERSTLWTEALALMDHANRDWKRVIGDLAAAEDAQVLRGMLRAAQRLQVWDSLLPIVGCMSEASQRKLAALPDLADIDVLDSIIGAAEKNALWGDLLPLVGYMHERTRRAAAQAVERLPSAVLLNLLDTANQKNLWPDLIAILRLMDETEQREVLRLIGTQDASVLRQLMTAMDAANLWQEIAPLLPLMDAAARAQLAQLLPQFPQAMLLRLIETVDALDLWPMLLALSAEMDASELKTIADLLAQQPAALLTRLLRSVETQALWPQLLPIAARMNATALATLATPLRETVGARLPQLETLARELKLHTPLAALFSKTVDAA